MSRLYRFIMGFSWHFAVVDSALDERRRAADGRALQNIAVDGEEN